MKQLLLDLPTDAPVRGIGIGVLGAVDSVSGRTLGDPLLAGWDRYPIRDRLASAFDVPVWVDNDVNMMAVGELKAGAARGQHNLIYHNMSGTIRAGIVSNGRLHRGEGAPLARSATSRWSKNHQYRAGAEDKGASCASQVATSSPRPQRCLQGDTVLFPIESPTTVASQAHDVADAARAGDPVGMELISRAGILTGKALANLVNTFNPGQILIGGTLAAAGETLLTAIQNAVLSTGDPRRHPTAGNSVLPAERHSSTARGRPHRYRSTPVPRHSQRLESARQPHRPSRRNPPTTASIKHCAQNSHLTSTRRPPVTQPDLLLNRCRLLTDNTSSAARAIRANRSRMSKPDLPPGGHEPGVSTRLKVVAPALRPATGPRMRP